MGLPVRALSPIFRAKFRDAMADAGLLGEIDAKVWTVDWNVNCQPEPQVSVPLCLQGRHLGGKNRPRR